MASIPGALHSQKDRSVGDISGAAVAQAQFAPQRQTKAQDEEAQQHHDEKSKSENKISNIGGALPLSYYNPRTETTRPRESAGKQWDP